jgi:hypothetical protein
MSTPRSLADDLRQRDDAALGRLLRRRPDLVHPVPADFTALTARATAGPAVARCLDGLDSMHLHVLRSAAELTVDCPRSGDEIIAAAMAPLPSDAMGACRSALDDLVDLALLWGVPEALRAVVPVRELVTGAPVPQWPRPGAGDGQPHDAHDVDGQAALHAREALALVRDLLDDWSVHPPGILRSGGLSLRDFAAARARLHADWARTALTIEIAFAARLVADDSEEAPHWVPTDHFDAWVSKSPAEQWIDLVDAWLTLPRLPSLADEKTQVLTADRDRRAIPVLRRDIITLLASLPVGTSLSEERILAVLDDRQPRRTGELRRLTVAATLREGADLGLLGAGALSTAARMLIDSDATSPATRRTHAQRVASALSEALPVDVDHVLIQADLTVVAPGPLVASVARSLRMLAEVESRGHATVFRVSESSVRRALDAGWDAEAIHSLLGEISRTPVPQPLTYLIDDVARRYGAVRVGSALAYIRSDNADALAALVTDRRLKSLGLHRIADTVVICHAPTSEVITALRATGYAPAAESPDGAVVIRRPEDRRIRAPRAATVTTRRPPEDALVTAAVRTLRAGDKASAPRAATVVGPASRPDLPSLSSAAIVSALRDALADNRPLWIGYADTDGAVSQQIVDPIRLHGGVLTAFDHRTDSVRQFAVSRVTGVAGLPPDEA